jgi:CBS domain-containing protein/gamma-glutamyl:cysteine ligase YbdK (ATP-grasp superfamily)
MGDLKVTKLTNKKSKDNYIYHLLKDIEALDIMLKKGMIEKSPIRIGCEQEFCLINSEFLPCSNSLEILQDINDEHFTTEIGNYNLEINLPPFELKNNCFSKLNQELSRLLNKAKEKAKKKNTKILLTGILPTLSLKHIKVENMTQIQRYYVLNEAIKESRNQNFNIHIKGVDELNLLHDSVMLEGCNTSFQIHLQISPDEFIDSYNWAQTISGPILSACTNSPLLFGKELWSETRIALFTQSIDTRANSFLLSEKQSRVSFGKEWAKGSVTDIFKDNISRFRSLLTSEFTKDSVEALMNDEIPTLHALNLHNGTIYRWNRPCYGVGNGKPHLRIENRYIPSGPTIIDEVANIVFWVGVMLGKPKTYKNIHKKIDFKDVKTNFFSAARYGMSTQFYWNGAYISSHDLILKELLPMAYNGLEKAGVSHKDTKHYLTIIKDRVESNNNGSQWMTQSFRNILKTKKKFEASQILTAEMYRKQEYNQPVSTWDINPNIPPPFVDTRIVKHIMSTDIFSVYGDDSVTVVLQIMKWKSFHHMPVINKNKELIGLLIRSDLTKYLTNNQNHFNNVTDIMKKKVITIDQYKSLVEAKKIMNKHKINCLPVIKENKLIGLVTSHDFKQ